MAMDLFIAWEEGFDPASSALMIWEWSKLRNTMAMNAMSWQKSY